MASNLPHVMTRSQAIDQFEEVILPMIQKTHEQDGIPDYIARREAWNDWTDGLCKDEIISDWQYNNWSHPDCCG